MDGQGRNGHDGHNGYGNSGAASTTSSTLSTHLSTSGLAKPGRATVRGGSVNEQGLSDVDAVLACVADDESLNRKCYLEPQP